MSREPKAGPSPAAEASARAAYAEAASAEVSTDAPASDDVVADAVDGEGTPDESGSPFVDAEGNALSLDDIDVATLLEEREQFLQAYQRTAADFDNFRKQSHKRLEDEVVRTVGSFVERLLPVLDAIDAARGHGSQDVEAVANALYGFLEREGLERVDPSGQPFDPNIAEAVIHEPGDGDPVVTEVLRTGYAWKGRVVRAAMVKVRG